MKPLHTTPRPARTSALVLTLTLPLALLALGCAQNNSPNNPQQTTHAPTPAPAPTTTNDPYQGPPVTIQSNAPTHTVLITAPTGGWSVLWDRKVETQNEIYLTLRQPDPAFFQIQQIVEHRIDSTIPTNQPLRVFVRMVEHNDRTNTAPYRSAAHADN